ncbi:HAD family hydrolase [Nocardia bovistercoris]|uniref:HAD family hydrolase n=1 Tax=Nocardia bovistercoris TaxID=2785916 RepID=A0A931IIU6_9NOCA|nr:HAD family hydrolase [Nocardia bovistercoris]
MTFTVGFDLDMTLIDSRPGVAKAIDQVGAEFGLPLDGQLFATRLGPPLAQLLTEIGAPVDLVPALTKRYRELYPSIVPHIVALPGAEAALAAVRDRGGRVLVVTGKHEPHARLHIDALDWKIDALVGDLWSAGKADALRTHGAGIFVGDHAGDMIGAKAADSYAVGVTTGPCDADELRTAGADVILPDLTDFPRWLADHRPARAALSSPSGE